MDPNYDGGDHQAYLEECKEAFDEDHADLIKDWTDKEYQEELERYCEICEDDDGGEGDAKYDAMRDAEIMAPYEMAIERGEIGPDC